MRFARADDRIGDNNVGRVKNALGLGIAIYRTRIPAHEPVGSNAT